MLTPHQSPCGRDARELDRGEQVPGHEPADRDEEEGFDGTGCLMENASGDLRRALGGPILGRQMLEPTRHAVEEFAELDAHNFQKLIVEGASGIQL